MKTPGHADLDGMALILTCTPAEQLAALGYLTDRIRSDIAKGTDAAKAVSEFIYYGARQPVLLPAP